MIIDTWGLSSIDARFFLHPEKAGHFSLALYNAHTVSYITYSWHLHLYALFFFNMIFLYTLDPLHPMFYADINKNQWSILVDMVYSLDTGIVYNCQSCCCIYGVLWRIMLPGYVISQYYFIGLCWLAIHHNKHSCSIEPVYCLSWKGCWTHVYLSKCLTLQLTRAEIFLEYCCYTFIVSLGCTIWNI